MKSMLPVLFCGVLLVQTTNTHASGFAPAAISETLVTDFNAIPNVQHSVSVSWVSTPKVNAEVFTIERSADGKLFSAWRSVQGPGTASQRLEYLEIDNEPLTGTTFYRLMQINGNGDTSHSEIRVVRHTATGEVVELPVLPYTLPAPADNTEKEVKNSNEVLLVLHDRKGQVYFVKAVMLMKENEIAGVVFHTMPVRGKYSVVAASREGLEGTVLMVP